MTKRSGFLVFLGAILILSLSVVACSSQPAAPAKPADQASKPAAAEPTKAAAAEPAKKVDYPTKNITFIAPSKPGSGFDVTARAVAATLEKEKLVPVSLPVENSSSSVEGFATIVQRHKNDPNMIAIGSLTPLLNKSTGASPYGHKDFTPISGLIKGYYGFIVRADSPYKTLMDLLKDLKEKPEQTPMCGGASDDRITYGVVGLTYGVDLKKINYAAYSGGTEASTVLLEGTAKAEITSIDDIMGLIEAKKLRVLAVSGSTRLGGVLADVPTFKEAGLDLEWVNTRYVIGGPNMPDYAVQYWQGVLAKMVKTPTWQEMLQQYRWVDDFSVQDFDKRLDGIATQIDKVAAELGMKAS